MVAQVCDLLDAAAALAGVPSLALFWVRETKGGINSKAWTNTPEAEDEPSLQGKVINRAKQHQFSQADLNAIKQGLDELDGKSNRAAWQFLRETFPRQVLIRRLKGLAGPDFIDDISTDGAIDDIGADTPNRVEGVAKRYARDPRICEKVKARAHGQCELCGEFGFECEDGTRYLECHHIIALANDGADRMTNVIALCPKDHREAHFGKHRVELEKQMISKVNIKNTPTET